MNYPNAIPQRTAAPDYGIAGNVKMPEINEIPRLVDEIEKVISGLGENMNELHARLGGVLPGPAPSDVGEPCESGLTPLGCRLISIRERIKSLNAFAVGLHKTVQL